MEPRKLTVQLTAGAALTPSPFGGYPLPMLNLHDHDQLQALLEVIDALEGLPLGGKLQFLLGRKGSLGGVTPLEALERGRLEKVLDVANAFAEQGPGRRLADLGGRAPDIESAPRRRPAALVTTDPDVCAGRPCFAGHWLPVEMVLGRLGAGDSMAVLQRDYPWLTDDHVAAARAYVTLAEAADITFDAPKAVIVAKPADLSDG